MVQQLPCLNQLLTKTKIMKTIVTVIIAIASILMFKQDAKAQAWERNSQVLSLGVGASNFYHVAPFRNGNSGIYRSVYSPTTGQFNFMGEFGIHKYVGLGFYTGVGGRASWGGNYLGEVNFPIGLICNFHFYQLIADKTSKNIHSDVLDVYAGLSAGSGLAIVYFQNDPDQIAPLVFAGPHAGIRWWFAPKVGLNAELGFGKNIANFGFVFKP